MLFFVDVQGYLLSYCILWVGCLPVLVWFHIYIFPSDQFLCTCFNGGWWEEVHVSVKIGCRCWWGSAVVLLLVYTLSSFILQA